MFILCIATYRVFTSQAVITSLSKSFLIIFISAFFRPRWPNDINFWCCYPARIRLRAPAIPRNLAAYTWLTWQTATEVCLYTPGLYALHSLPLICSVSLSYEIYILLPEMFRCWSCLHSGHTTLNTIISHFINYSYSKRLACSCALRLYMQSSPWFLPDLRWISQGFVKYRIPSDQSIY
jgi:hypothetical protein